MKEKLATLTVEERVVEATGDAWVDFIATWDGGRVVLFTIARPLLDLKFTALVMGMDKVEQGARSAGEGLNSPRG